MKVTVVGGAGYIGSVLCPKLAEAGHEVTVVDLCWFGDSLPKGIKVIKERADHITKKSLDGQEAVIYLAGLSNDPMADFDSRANFVSNAATPAYVAYQARLAGVKKFIHGSSCSVYGFIGNKDVDESADITSQNPYAVSKYMAERGCAQQSNTGMQVFNFRQGTVCGSSPRMRYDLVLNSMVRDAVVKGCVEAQTDTFRPLLYIDDAVEAYKLALDPLCSPLLSQNEVFNIASENMDIEELARVVCLQVGKLSSKTIFLKGKKADNLRSYTVSTDRAENYLVFRPTIGLEKIIKRVYYQTLNLIDCKKDLYKAPYINIEVFKELHFHG